MGRDDYGGRKRTTFGERYIGSRSGRRFETVYPPAGEHIPSKNQRRFISLRKGPPLRKTNSLEFLREIWRSLARSEMTQKLEYLLPLLGLIVGAILLSGNITGNAILNASQTDANLAGVFAIILGLTGLLLLERR